MNLEYFPGSLCGELAERDKFAYLFERWKQKSHRAWVVDHVETKAPLGFRPAHFTTISHTASAKAFRSIGF